MEKNEILENRRYTIGLIILVIVIIYVCRLAELQLISDEYKTKADSNAYFRNIIYPSRGNIYDRKGKLLVYNQQAYDIMCTVNDMVHLDTIEFCENIGITKETFLKRMEDIQDLSKNRSYSRYSRQLFAGQLTPEDYSVFQEKIMRYPGFSFQKRNIRKYTYPYLAHVLGDVGEVDPSDIEKDEYYSAGDYCGKQGVERSYEKELRGEKGVQILMRDARGMVHGHYKNGEEDIKPRPGKDITLSIDLDLQQLGERLMKGKRGAIVAIEPQTGEILCMVSSPTYDPRKLVGKERGKYMNQLIHDNSNPLLNRATLGAYPPGSTFKPTQALTFLQEHIITPNSSFPCVRGFKHLGMKVGCHTHDTPIALANAIATSCNGYFCWGLYYMLSNRKNYESLNEAMTKWKNYMVSMGFGYKLGVDLPSESRGLIPNAKYYDKAYHGKWTPLSVISISIGQGEVLATPVQIANLAATIANRGKYKIPHVVHSIQDGTVADSLTTFKNTDVTPAFYGYVVEGMRKAVTSGTCRGANIPGYDVCGKTGTAQNPHGQDHSAFMGFAPMTNPKIAICVYVENGEWGATYGVPIGALMMEQYLRGYLTPAAEAQASLFEYKRISYNPVNHGNGNNSGTKKEPDKQEDNKTDNAQQEQKSDNELTDSVNKTTAVKKDNSNKTDSVFHKWESPEQKAEREKREKAAAEKAAKEALRQAEVKRKKEEAARRKAENERKKAEEARKKAEIRHNAEVARKKAADIKRKEEEEKLKNENAARSKRQEAYDKALEVDRLVRQMKEKIGRN